jgi:hypothetical protein
MTLRQRQVEFTKCVARLIDKAFSMGFEVTLGEVYRSPAEAERLAKLGLGVVNSAHTYRLAIDLNLFKDGKYLTRTEDHRPLGEWWVSYGRKNKLPLYWGGHFSHPDGNHYSMEYVGIK